MGTTRREKLYSIVTLKRRFLSLLALLQCFNRFAASLVSGAHTIQLDFIVVAQLVNFFLRWYIRKFASSAAFGIYIVVYFIQTLGAMFAASITAKTGRFFIINVLYNSNVFVQKNWLLLTCKRAVADHELGLKISIEYVNVNIKWPDSAATTKNSHLIHQSSIPWPFNVKALLLQPYPVYSYTN